MAAGIAESHANAKGTTKKQTCYWEKWELYLHSIKLESNPFLQKLDPPSHTILVATFAAAYQDNCFTKQIGPLPPGHGTITEAINAVAKTFRENNFESPIRN